MAYSEERQKHASIAPIRKLKFLKSLQGRGAITVGNPTAISHSRVNAQKRSRALLAEVVRKCRRPAGI
jgi:hypothetical protein